jgi:hypothetical protein
MENFVKWWDPSSFGEGFFNNKTAFAPLKLTFWTIIINLL